MLIFAAFLAMALLIVGGLAVDTAHVFLRKSQFRRAMDASAMAGITRYQSGQAYYENKLRMGSKLTRNQMYFKHRNALAQGILKLAAPVLSADDTVK